MRHAEAVAGGRSGFTLLEILVALVLIGLLVGAVVPSVLNQVSRGEVNRVVEDLNSVANATKTFRVDVNRWPGSLEDLVTRPSSAALDVNGRAYQGLVNRWAGPYIEQGEIDVLGLATSMGGMIDPAFGTADWGGEDFVVIEVTGLTTDNTDAIDLAIDGVADVANGKVRVDETTPTAPVLQYYATPVK